MTWVVSDYTATPGTSEVTVLKGQQVEIIDTACSGAPEYCQVRLHNPSNGSDTNTQEGLVPVAILKPPPSGKNAHRRNVDSSDTKEHPEGSGK